MLRRTSASSLNFVGRTDLMGAENCSIAFSKGNLILNNQACPGLNSADRWLVAAGADTLAVVVDTLAVGVDTLVVAPGTHKLEVVTTSVQGYFHLPAWGGTQMPWRRPLKCGRETWRFQVRCCQ
jgi:hypothetical protein